MERNYLISLCADLKKINDDAGAIIKIIKYVNGIATIIDARQPKQKKKTNSCILDLLSECERTSYKTKGPLHFFTITFNVISCFRTHRNLAMRGN